jgi:hypothetical protein
MALVSVERYELVSLMELLRFEADAYCRLMNMLGQILAHFTIASGPGSRAGLSLTNEVYGELGATLGEIDKQVAILDLPMSKKHFDRLKWAIYNDKNSFTLEVMQRNVSELITRIVDELSERLFLNVPPQQASLYLQSEPPFGKEVTARFPQMTEDISEAAKCLSLNRPTAAVFHLMRIMESAVQSFGTELGVTLASEQNWQVILDQINAAVRKMDPKKDPLAAVYAEAASHLYNVKVAWRNQVMHPKQTYTFEEAKAIFGGVSIFMGDLSKIV